MHKMTKNFLNPFKKCIFIALIALFVHSSAYAALYIAPEVQEQDDAGEPCTGCLLYFYSPGTSTPKSTYQDSGLATPHTNPVVADSAGRFSPIYLDGAYKVVLKDADGVTIWTVDNYGVTEKNYFGESEDINTTTAIDASYETKHLRVTGTTSLNLLAASTAGEGFMFSLHNDGSGLVTIDPNGSEEINDASTAIVPPNGGGIVISDGSEWSFINTPGIPASLANGDILYNSTSSGIVRLAIGATGEFLSVSSGLPAWNSINDYTDTDITASDEIIFGDTSDSNNHKKDTVQALLNLALMPNYLSGLSLSNDTDTDHDILIATGSAADSSNATLLSLSTAITKRIDATWAAGDDAGGLFSGSVANNTTYHIFLIEKDSDGSIDAGFDTSLTAANIPAGYTKYRRIGSVLTDGSANIINFVQHGDDFIYDTPILDVNNSSTGTSANTGTASIPTGLNLKIYYNALVADNGAYSYISSLDNTDLAASSTAAPLSSVGSGTANDTKQGEVWSNTSRQFRYRTSSSTTLRFATLGYMDLRGK